MKLTIYKEGFKVKLHNKRVTVREVEDSEFPFKVQFARLLKKDEQIEESKTYFIVRKKVVITQVALSEDAIRVLFEGWMHYTHNKNNRA